MKTSELSPYLSFVVTARNDDHGGNLLQRMQLFLNGLLEQCSRHRLSAELIVVEWNPPSDKPRLAEVLKWPHSNGYCSVHIIEVPPEVHRRFKHSDNLPLFQMIAKNVGIRRARGQFVLATNIDILFSDELMQFLTSGGLLADKHYRVDRYDVSADVPAYCPINEQMEFCKANVLRVNRRDGTFIVNKGSDCNYTWLAQKSRSRAIRFLKVPWRFVWWLSLLPNLLIFKAAPLFIWWMTLLPNRLLWLSMLMLLRFGEFKAELRNYFHRAWEILGMLSPFHFANLAAVHLHTNACGDFALMAREQWFGLRGYPELEIFSLHLDSLLCYMAYHSDIKENLLPYPVFHIEHASGWSPDSMEKLLTRIKSKGIPVLSYGELLEWDRQMSRQHKPIMFNNESWGLASEELPEIVILQ